MKLSIGIVGLPNVGKSTLFKILTKQAVNIANYPFTTIEPNVGVVAVPDERLRQLSELTGIKNIVPAVVEFYDIAGLVKGASKDEGLGNQFLSHIRETQGIVIVIRTFKNPEIVHIENSVEPLRDIETVNLELILKDLETIEKRLPKAEAEAKSGKKEARQDLEILIVLREYLESGKPVASSAEFMSLIRANGRIKDLNLLTAKEQLCLLNGKAEEVSPELIKKIKSLGGDYLVADLANIEAVPELIKKAYQMLGLISFFTFVGEKELRTWTCREGTKAPQAAGVIHTDFEKNYIRTEVINWQKLLKAGGWTQAKQKGWIRLEGKDYEIKDGDVLVVHHG